MGQRDAPMIVLMTAMVHRVSQNLSRYSYLLLLLVFVNCNSQNNKKEELQLSANEKFAMEPQSDSLALTIRNVPAGATSGFEYMDSHLKPAYVNFVNKTKEKQNITMKMPKMGSNDFVLMYRCFVYIHGKSSSIKHDYYIKSDVNTIDFEFDNGDVLLKSNEERIIILDSLYKQYSAAYKKNYLAKNISMLDKIKTFEKLHNDNKKIFLESNEKIKLDNDELEFLNRLSVIKGNDKRIEYYLEHLQNPIWSSSLTGVFYGYLESIKDSIYTIDLNDKDLSDSFKQILPIKVSWHLQKHKSKKYPNYEKNVEWLAKTEYYKKNKTKVDIDLKPENKDEHLIAKKMGSFSVYNKSNDKTDLKSIIQKEETEYYLFDFWASWCAPCIKDSELIHEMSLPKNLKVVNISLDKTKDREKWKNKAIELGIEDSYLFVEDSYNKDFFSLINLNQIPRYILINKDFKILDIDMISPSEGNFKNEIENLISKNNKKYSFK